MTEPDQPLIRIDQAGYTHDETFRLGGYIHDALWESGLGHMNEKTLYMLATLAASFTTTQEAWDLGRKDLPKLGKFIADAMLELIQAP